MKHLIPQTMAAVSVLALALAVGGCGSSSDGDTGMDTTPTSADMQAECEGKGGRYETDGSCTSVADQIAEAAAAATAKACTDEGGRPETDGSCTSAADVMAEIAMACEDEGGEYADGLCTTAAELADAAAIVAETEAAGTKATAIGVEAAVAAADNDGPGGAGATIDHAITIKHDAADGTTVTIVVVGAMDDDPKFMQDEDLGDGRTTHVRTMKADDDGNVAREVMIVSTDIEAPTDTLFEDVDGQMLNANPETTIGSDFQSLTVTTANIGHVMSNAFSAATMATLTFDADDDNTDGMDEAFETAGTYNGAPGTYRCDGNASCTVMLDADDMITAMNGWIFTPEPGAESAVADADYLHYGFWLMKTTDANGADTYAEVETFAGSSIAVSTGVSSVEGTANYKGGSTGVYVRNVYNPDRTVDTATAGHFKADVDLMAYFGGTSVAEDDQNTVIGTIDNFSLSGEEDASGWGVDVEASIAGDGFTGMAKGGGGGNGSISGTFRGLNDSYDHDMDVRLTTLTVSPAPWSASSTLSSRTAPLPAGSEQESRRTSQPVRVPSMRT